MGIRSTVCGNYVELGGLISGLLVGIRGTVCGNYVAGRGIGSSHWWIIGGNKIDILWNWQVSLVDNWWD